MQFTRGAHAEHQIAGNLRHDVRSGALIGSEPDVVSEFPFGPASLGVERYDDLLVTGENLPRRGIAPVHRVQSAAANSYRRIALTEFAFPQFLRPVARP